MKDHAQLQRSHRRKFLQRCDLRFLYGKLQFFTGGFDAHSYRGILCAGVSGLCSSGSARLSPHYKPSCTASCILSRLSNLRLSCSNLRRISESASNSRSSSMCNLVALNLQLGLTGQQLDMQLACHSGNALQLTLQLAAGGHSHTRI